MTPTTEAGQIPVSAEVDAEIAAAAEYAAARVAHLGLDDGVEQVRDTAWCVRVELRLSHERALIEAIADHLVDALPNCAVGITDDHIDAQFTAMASISGIEALSVGYGEMLKAMAAVAPDHILSVGFVSGEVLSYDELDRRLAVPVIPPLVGVAEVAEILKVTRQRASVLQTHRGFPPPVAHVAATPLWLRSSIEAFDRNWDRKPGRPAKV